MDAQFVFDVLKEKREEAVGKIREAWTNSTQNGAYYRVAVVISSTGEISNQVGEEKVAGEHRELVVYTGTKDSIASLVSADQQLASEFLRVYEEKFPQKQYDDIMISLRQEIEEEGGLEVGSTEYLVEYLYSFYEDRVGEIFSVAKEIYEDENFPEEDPVFEDIPDLNIFIQRYFPDIFADFLGAADLAEQNNQLAAFIEMRYSPRVQEIICKQASQSGAPIGAVGDIPGLFGFVAEKFPEVRQAFLKYKFSH